MSKKQAKLTTSSSQTLQNYSGSLLLVLPSPTSSRAQVTQFLQENNLLAADAAPTKAQWFNPPEEPLKIKVVREFLSQVNYSSYDGKLQLCILSNIDTGSLPAQNALLKIIEEPPPKKQLILTASDLNLVLPTIKSRCLLKKIDKKHSTQSGSGQEPDQQQTKHLLQLLMHPEKMSYSKAIELAKEHSNREEAGRLIKELITQLQQLPAHKRPVAVQKNLLATYQQLNQNLNVKLSLEHCLFQIKQL